MKYLKTYELLNGGRITNALIRDLMYANRKWNELMQAIDDNRFEDFRMYIHLLDIEAEDKNGNTALMIAASCGRLKMQCRLYRYRTKNGFFRPASVQAALQNGIEIKQGLEIINITIDTIDMGSDIRFTGLYYNPDTKLTMIDFMPQNDNVLDSLSDYLSHVISKYAADKRNYITTMKEGVRFWVELKDIKNIIKDINQKDFDFFMDANKYNL